MLTFVGAAGPVRGKRLDGEDGCKVIRHRKLDRSGKRSPAIFFFNCPRATFERPINCPGHRQFQAHTALKVITDID